MRLGVSLLDAIPVMGERGTNDACMGSVERTFSIPDRRNVTGKQSGLSESAAIKGDRLRFSRH